MASKENPRVYAQLSHDTYDEYEKFRDERDLSKSECTRRLIRAGLNAQDGGGLKRMLAGMFGGLVSMTLAFGAVTVGVYVALLVVLVGVLGLALGYAIFDVLEGTDVDVSALRFWDGRAAK